jgi:hypothetical protein
MSGVSVEYKGWIRADAEVSGGLGIDAVLNDTGAYGVSVMHDKTKPYDASGRLSDSIMWETDKASSGVAGKYAGVDELPRISDVNTVVIGSGAPHAPYRETYSGIHKSSEGSAEFITSLKEWVRTVIGVEPDDDSMGKAIFEAILAEIRDNKTPGKPFVEPSVDEIVSYALKQLNTSIGTYMSTMNKSGGGT